MAVYYKFKSAKDYDSVPIDGHFISVLNLKEKIFESKHLGRGTDFDLVVTNAQTNEEYLDEDMLVPKNTSVLIRRIPRRTGMPIVTQSNIPKTEDMPNDLKLESISFLGSESSYVAKHSDDIEWDEFGNDLYENPEKVPVLLSNSVIDAPPPSKADEDSKIRALVDTPALDWQCQASDAFGGGNRGFGRGVGGRMTGPRGFGRGGFERGFDRGFERRTPPQGYICFRCKVPGHFIHHCPTNGDPNFDIKRAKPPTGIPKSMLIATPDGSYALPSGAVAVMRPNEAAFEKEIEGLPSTRCVGDLPPELHCPLCKEVMKDAVLTSKCCFNSFCDKCIREQIISKSACVCGATNMLADDLLPNNTLRVTINGILESNNSSAENAGSTFQIQDMESARCPPPRTSSPNLSAASMGERYSVPPQNEETSGIKENERLTPSPQNNSSKDNISNAVDVLEATLDAITVKEEVSHHSVLPEKELHPMDSAETGKKKKKKSSLPMNCVDMNWKTPQEFPPENVMMASGPCGYNPYWNGVQPGMDGGYMGGNPSNFYGAPMPYPNYFPPFDVPFHGIIPQQPYALPPRDVYGFEMGPPAMSREEFEARKTDLRRKREFERRGDIKDRETSSRNGPIPAMKSKPSKPTPPITSADHHHHDLRGSERRSPERSKRHETRKPDDRRENYRRENHRRSESTKSSPPSVSASAAEAERNHKASVFSRISFPERNAKKKPPSSSTEPPPMAPSGERSGFLGKISSADCESSDDDRHFKRKASTYGREEERRGGRYSRKRERSLDAREEVGGVVRHRKHR